MTRKIIYGVHNGQYVADGKQLIERYHWCNEPEILPWEFTCTHLIHFTDSAKEIGFENDSCFSFKPQKWNSKKKAKNNENGTLFEYLSWWNPCPPINWNEEGQKTHACKGDSAVFNGKSYCGPIGFKISWKNIMEQYEKSREKNDNDQIQLRVIGTFKYKREIMYAIMVCMASDQIEIKDKNALKIDLPSLTHETEAFKRLDDPEKFIWKVYSTTGYAPDTHFYKRTWDSVSFAFYFPDEDKRWMIPPNLCEIITKIATGNLPYTREKEIRKITTADPTLVNKLKEKIKKSMDETIIAATASDALKND